MLVSSFVLSIISLAIATASLVLAIVSLCISVKKKKK